MTRLSQFLLPTEKQPPERRGGDLAQADGEGRAGAPDGRRHVDLAAGRLAGPPAGGGDHPRGDGRDRRPGDADARAPAGRPVARAPGRLGIEELFKLTDRKGSELVLAMTHEEAVTFHVAQIVRSYRDLPLILYHFQVKERDEPRPRAGVLRTREFIMKDAYSFDRDQEALEQQLRAARGGLRPHHGAHRPALLPRRGRRRDDGRDGRPRVHGPVRRRRGRGRAGGGLRRQRRGRRAPARAWSATARASSAAASG